LRGMRLGGKGAGSSLRSPSITNCHVQAYLFAMYRRTCSDCSARLDPRDDGHHLRVDGRSRISVTNSCR
jgi:hypothetical protein